jgi:hypothetical protein
MSDVANLIETYVANRNPSVADRWKAIHELGAHLVALNLPDAAYGDDGLPPENTWAEVVYAHELGLLSVAEFYVISMERKLFGAELVEAVAARA